MIYLGVNQDFQSSEVGGVVPMGGGGKRVQTRSEDPIGANRYYSTWGFWDYDDCVISLEFVLNLIKWRNIFCYCFFLQNPFMFSENSCVYLQCRNIQSTVGGTQHCKKVLCDIIPE